MRQIRVTSSTPQPQAMPDPLMRFLTGELDVPWMWTAPQPRHVLTYHQIPNHREGFSASILGDGSRTGDLLCGLTATKRPLDPQSEIRDTGEEESYQDAMTTRVTLFRGPISSESIVLQACRLLARGICFDKERAHHEGGIFANEEETTVQEHEILTMLQNTRQLLLPEESQTFEFDDDDCTCRVSLECILNCDTIQFSLITKPLGDGIGLGFLLRHPTIGGGAYGATRNALIALACALKIEAASNSAPKAT